MKRLLIFYHSQTGENEGLVQAAHDSACTPKNTVKNLA